ncbi:MAG: hypothetical protein ACQER9_02760 [Nanobdellota archaeon]
MYLNAIREGYNFYTESEENARDISIQIIPTRKVIGEISFSHIKDGLILDNYAPFGQKDIPEEILGKGYATALEFEIAKILTEEFRIDSLVYLLATSKERKKQLSSRNIKPNSLITFGDWLYTLEYKLSENY